MHAVSQQIDIMNSVFKYEGEFQLTDQMKAAYDENGFIIVRNFMDKEEIGQILKTLEHPDGILKHSYTTVEPDGKEIKRVVYKHPGNDVTGMVARSEKIVDSCEKLLGGEVYQYHAKFILKDAFVGGEHIWHQDYGYWYDNWLLFPDMITVWIALDKATKANSCLQVLRGSHKCGRIRHHPGGTLQAGADLERVEDIKGVCPLLYCEMEPGDVLFQHCNLLHTSSNNDSNMRRWAFVVCYNTAANDPVVEHHHASYRPVNKVPNSEIKSCKNYTDFSGKEFINAITRAQEQEKAKQK